MQCCQVVQKENQKVPIIFHFNITHGMKVNHMEIHSVIIEISVINENIVKHFLRISVLKINICVFCYNMTKNLDGEDYHVKSLLPTYGTDEI